MITRRGFLGFLAAACVAPVAVAKACATMTKKIVLHPLSASSYPKWQNWTCVYSNVSRDDFVRQLREAAKRTKFTPPLTGTQYGFFTNYQVLDALEGKPPRPSPRSIGGLIEREEKN